MPDLQQELKALTARFEDLTRVNGFLRYKLKALECMLPHKDQHVGFLSVAQSTGQQANSSGGGALPAGAGSGELIHAASTAPAHGPLAQAACPHHMQQAHGHGSASLLELPSFLGTMGPPQPAVAACGEWAAGPNWQALNGGGVPGIAGMPAVLALCPVPDGPVQDITPAGVEMLRRVTPQEFRMLWKHMCLKTGLLVASAEAQGPGSPQHARMERFLERMIVYISKVCLLSPTCYPCSMYVNLETGQRERPGEDFWAAIGSSLAFTREQLQEVESLCAVHEQNVVPVLRERSTLVQQLTSLLAAVTSPHRACVSNDVVVAFHAVEDLVKRLQRNAFREMQAHGDTGGFLGFSVLTPLQLAKSIAASYPYIPDGVAIMHGVRALCNRQAPGAAPKPGS